GAKWIPLTKGKFTLVDNVDYEKVVQYSWYSRPAPNGEYAAHWGVISGHKNRAKNIFLHHFLLGTRDRVDHIDGDGLNNRRANLRRCTHSQNMANRRKFKGASSRFKGVSWSKKCLKWLAYVNCDGERHHLGLFHVEEDAAHAYDKAA